MTDKRQNFIIKAIGKLIIYRAINIGTRKMQKLNLQCQDVYQWEWDELLGTQLNGQ